MGEFPTKPKAAPRELPLNALAALRLLEETTDMAAMENNALEVYYEDFVNVVIRALVYDLNRNLPEGLETTGIKLCREESIAPRDDRRLYNQTTGSSTPGPVIKGPVEFTVSIHFEGGFAWSLLCVEVKRPAQYEKPASTIQAVYEGLALCSQNTHADQTLQCDDGDAVDAFLEEADFCPLCGKEGECSCDEEDVRMLVAEWHAPIFSPNIPVFAVLTDFKRWSVWEINGEPQADESFDVTRVVRERLGSLSGGINRVKLRVIYGHLYTLVQSSLQTLCDVQNGAAQ